MTLATDGRAASVLGVLVLADDLIWATRLVGQLRTIGVDPIRVGSAEAFAARLAATPADGPEAGRPGHAVIDLTARSYDGLGQVRFAVAAGLRVLCVGQHDDRALRSAARAAGAERVLAYRTLFENGHATLAAWLGVPAPAPGSMPISPSSEVPAR